MSDKDKQLSEEKDVRFPLYLSPTIKEEVKKKAKSMGITGNGYIRMLILQDLTK